MPTKTKFNIILFFVHAVFFTAPAPFALAQEIEISTLKEQNPLSISGNRQGILLFQC